MNFFFLQLYFGTSKTHISRIKKSYSNKDLHTVDPVAVGGFLIKEKLQAKLPKFKIIVLKPKYERKKCPKPKMLT